jgi:hypothetical protein
VAKKLIKNLCVVIASGKKAACLCWWLVVGGWWLVVVGGWWLVVGGWWLVVGGWWLVLLEQAVGHYQFGGFGCFVRHLVDCVLSQTVSCDLFCTKFDFKPNSVFSGTE